MTGDEFVRILVWLALGLWLGSLVLVKRRDRAAAAIQAVIALPFIIAPAITLIKWWADPTAYVRQYGTAALAELPGAAIILGAALITLLMCGLALRGRRLWLIVPFLLNALGVMSLFYFAYFFHVF